MPEEPTTKRVAAFVDGQNLFHGAKDAFGRRYPDFDPVALAGAVCGAHQDWDLRELHFYTGVPNAEDDPFWNAFWNSKLAVLGTRGVHCFQRPLRYHWRTVTLPDGSEHSLRSGFEKGIDVRLALDVVRLALDNAYDVALVFSQDQDLSEVAEELRVLARRERRWIKIASAFPVGDGSTNRRGINKTDWIPIGREVYEACLDPMDHRPKRPSDAPT
jgi:uncharacterized LabA/DUF88 family protein